MNSENIWSTSDIIENRNNWSLAADAELLKHLQNLSEKIFSKANSTLHSLNSLENEVTQTCISVANTSNKFKALSDTQFIESKVQDEEEFINSPNITQNNISEISSPEDITIQLKEALKNGFKVLDTRCEVYPATGSDSEDDELQDFLLKARNPYLSRRLPFIIGSVEFKNNDNLGLIDSSEDEEEDDEGDIEEEESEEEVEELREPVAPPKLPSYKTEYSRPQPQEIRISDSDTESEISFPVDRTKKITPEKNEIIPPYSFAAHLNATLKNQMGNDYNKISSDFGDSFSPPPFPGKDAHISSDDEPSDSSGDLFTSKKNVKNSNLDSNYGKYKRTKEADVLSKEPPVLEKPVQSRKLSITSKTSQHSDLSDSSYENPKTDQEKPPTSKVPDSKTSLNKKLVSALNAELNKKLKIKPNHSTPKSSPVLESKQTKKPKIFDEPDNLEETSVQASKEIRKPKIFDELDDSEEDLQKSIFITTKSKKSNLFDDDDIDDIFEKSPKKQEPPKTVNKVTKIAEPVKNISTQLLKKESLFGSDSDSEDDIASLINSQKKTVPKKSSLFDDLADSSGKRDNLAESRETKITNSSNLRSDVRADNVASTVNDIFEKLSKRSGERDKYDFLQSDDYLFGDSNSKSKNISQTSETKSKNSLDSEIFDKSKTIIDNSSKSQKSLFGEDLFNEYKSGDLFEEKIDENTSFDDDLFGAKKSSGSSDTQKNSSLPSNNLKNEEKSSSEKMSENNSVFSSKSKSNHISKIEDLFGEKSLSAEQSQSVGKENYFFDVPPMPKAEDVFENKENTFAITKEDLNSDSDSDQFSFNCAKNQDTQPIPQLFFGNELEKREDSGNSITNKSEGENESSSVMESVKETSSMEFESSVKNRMKNFAEKQLQNENRNNFVDEKDGNLFAKGVEIGKIPRKIAINKGLNINVNALLPGTNWSSKMKQKPSLESEQLDEPQEQPNLLNNVVKERVKISNKRRPPSRRARINRMTEGNIFIDNYEVLKSSHETVSELNKPLENSSSNLFPKDHSENRSEISDLNIGSVQPKLLGFTKNRAKIPQKRGNRLSKETSNEQIPRYKTDNEHVAEEGTKVSKNSSSKDDFPNESENNADLFVNKVKGDVPARDLFDEIFGNVENKNDKFETDQNSVIIFAEDKNSIDKMETKVETEQILGENKRDIFGVKNEKTNFKDLIDDSNDDIFGCIETKSNLVRTRNISTSAKEKSQAHKTRSIFGEEEIKVPKNILFDEPVQKSEKPQASEKNNIFDDDEVKEPEKTEIFKKTNLSNDNVGEAKKAGVFDDEVKSDLSKAPKKTNIFGSDISKIKKNVFDEEISDLMSVKATKKTSIFDNDEILPAKKTSVFDDDVSDYVIIEDLKKTSIFDDDEIKAGKPQTSKKSNTFNNDEVSKSKKMSIFDDDDEDFKSTKSETLKKNDVMKDSGKSRTTKKTNIFGKDEAKSGKTQASKKTSLFGDDDDDDEDLFATTKKTMLANRTSKKSPLFEDDDDGLFDSKGSKTVSDKSADALFTKTNISKEKPRIVKLRVETVEKDPLAES